ncbi:hypothetical protein Bca52824_012249 [Brassica carinata]|uniref:Uncharacterized protein n=1 Tax=Brassica carinata TaxID=52824 RepID=A0A8X7VWK6_BRACI|nr:hypothetical protein Bca52824_012249 [Brassica carinata]
MVKPMIADLDRLYELMDSTHQDSSRLRALREELKNPNREREEAEKTEIDKEESEKEVDRSNTGRIRRHAWRNRWRRVERAS